MPEGHTIHRLAADHQRRFAGRTLRVSSPQGRFATQAEFLDGRKLLSVEALGKHLLYRWEPHTLHIHLGLYGRFRHYRRTVPEPRGQVRLRMIGPGHAFDLNGPNACELLTAEQEHRLLSRIGPDPLRSDADPERAWQRISRSRSAIAALLLDQSVIAGIGNVYRAEILHLLGMPPQRSGRDLSRAEFDALWDLACRLLRIGRQHNRIIIADPAELGKPRSRMTRDERLLVYKRDACRRCETPIQSITLAARKLYYCPVCQSGDS